MSQRELHRLELIQKVSEKRLSQKQAAEHLGLGTRQMRRLMRAYDAQGASALASKKRGRPSNRKLSDAVKQTAVALVRERYSDFGPTFANEKLRELHDLKISDETLRKWMAAEGIWLPRSRRRSIHQPRHRRACLGELVQIDGSPHAWLEERGPKSTLLVFIDDATSRLMHLQFVPTESTFDYMEATKYYIARHGKPVAFYSDKHTIFRAPDSTRKNVNGGQTQFGRALNHLNIEIICASTPQAKGRVERANLTLQDRLVKELRLRKIASVDKANCFLPDFIEDYNKRFAKAPANPHNAHRPLRPGESIDDAMTWQSTRRITKDLVVHYNHKMYHVTPSAETKRFAGKYCTIYEWADGRVALRYNEEEIPYTIFDKNPVVTQAAVVENKHLEAVMAHIRAQQLERDELRLKNPKITLRSKSRIRAQMTAV